MTEMQVLTGRSPAAPKAASEHVDQQLMVAKEIAKSGDFLPKAYRGKPGAVILALDFAAKHDLDYLTALQGVAIISGRVMIEAGLAEEFANRKGYEVRVVELTDERCETHLILDGEIAADGKAIQISTLADANPRNPVWKTNPKDMLHANSIRRLCKYWAKGMPVLIRDEVEAEPDAIAVLTAAAVAETIVEDSKPDPEPPQDVSEAVEVIEVPAPGEHPDMPTVDEIKSALKAENISKVKALRVLSLAGLDCPHSSLDDVAENPDAWAYLNLWIASGAEEPAA